MNFIFSIKPQVKIFSGQSKVWLLKLKIVYIFSVKCVSKKLFLNLVCKYVQLFCVFLAVTSVSTNTIATKNRDKKLTKTRENSWNLVKTRQITTKRKKIVKYECPHYTLIGWLCCSDQHDPQGEDRMARKRFKG